MTGTKRIAFYAPPGLIYVNQLAAGIARYQAEHPECSVRSFHPPYAMPVKKISSTVPPWKDWNPHGILCHINWEPSLPEWLRRGGTPIVSTCLEYTGTFPVVHGRGAAALAVQHFCSLGLKHFAFVGIPQHRHLGLYNAFAKCATEHGIDSVSLCSLRGDSANPTEEGEEGFLFEPELPKFLSDLPKPVGLFAANHDLAREVNTVCNQLGLDIPGKVAILCVADGHNTMLDAPVFSMIYPPGEEVGYQAIRLLDSLIQGAEPPTEPIKIPCHHLIVQESTQLEPSSRSLVRKALHIINERACRGLRVEDVANELDVSRSLLHTRFVEFVGHSLSEEIARLRLERSKQLLLETNLSVTKISGMVSFARSSVFGEFFKRETGMTPTQFRKVHQSQ